MTKKRRAQGTTMGSGRHGQLFSPSGPGSSCIFLYWLDERKALLSGSASYQLFMSFRRVLQRTHTVLRRRGHRPWCCFIFFIRVERSITGVIGLQLLIGFKLLRLPCQHMANCTEKMSKGCVLSLFGVAKDCYL